ncbi:MAG: NUDIX hydrolase [Elusimicrobia bacterium]|nr:NUDIX hydrolase [Elusimicrobiota bacterium]
MNIAIGIVLRNNKVLIQRRIRKGIFVYEFPMGKVEAEESFVDAAIRELREETGVNAIKAKKKPIILKNATDDNVAFIILNIPDNETPRITNPQRQQTFYWMEFSEIPMDNFHKTDKEFIEIMTRPKYLWHGSCDKYETLKPSQATDFTNPMGNLNGVYATPIKEVATTFAMGNKPDSQGRITKFIKGTENVKMVFLYGSPNWGGVGYLYKLAYDGFTEVCKKQFISENETPPMEIIEINVDDYKHLVRNATEEEITTFNKTGKI